MKIGIFTDSHYSSQALTCGKRFNSRSLVKIRNAYEYFRNCRCELVLCLGDLIDKEGDHAKEIENLKAVSAVIASSSVPTVCLMGNHDAFTFTVDEFYSILGGCIPNNMCINGKEFVFLDNCYFASGVHYMPGDSDWEDTFYPHIDELKQIICSRENDTFVFMHQNVDPALPEDHRLSNSAEIFELLTSSDKVKAVFQGHYHPGHVSKYNGIDFITLPAMCERDDAVYVYDI